MRQAALEAPKSEGTFGDVLSGLLDVTELGRAGKRKNKTSQVQRGQFFWGEIFFGGLGEFSMGGLVLCMFFLGCMMLFTSAECWLGSVLRRWQQAIAEQKRSGSGSSRIRFCLVMFGTVLALSRDFLF